MKRLDGFFNARCVAVIGASRDANKVGHVIVKNLLDVGFNGKVIPVNPKAEKILGLTCYPSLKDIKDQIDLAVIAVGSIGVFSVVKECQQAGIKHLVIISSGFGEVGNKEAEEKIKDYLNAHDMVAVGVNCLGIYDAHHKLDTLFIPRYRLKRPHAGGIGFICQSGAIGAAILDIGTERNHAFSKFISFGNATQIDESDLLEYLGEDKDTKVICMYLEGVRNGERFFKIARKISKKKPIIAIKGGMTEAGSKAAISHTGTLAGTREAYLGIFSQTGIISAESLEEMFDIASLIDKGIKMEGNRIQIITNGGGYGILSADLIAEAKVITLAKPSLATLEALKGQLPPYLSFDNPLDLVGDTTTERYRIALNICSQDKGIDAFLVIVLYQTPLITTDIVEIISQTRRETKKPIVVVSTGGEFTETLSKSLEDLGVSTLRFPRNAVRALDSLAWYAQKRRTL